MDWKETLLTREFKAYRKRQVKEIANMVHAELKNADPIYLKGLLDMAYRIMKLPSILINDEEVSAELDRLLTEDITDLTMEMVREQLKGD